LYLLVYWSPAWETNSAMSLQKCCCTMGDLRKYTQISSASSAWIHYAVIRLAPRARTQVCCDRRATQWIAIEGVRALAATTTTSFVTLYGK
jgi:hypothetical protein